MKRATVRDVSRLSPERLLDAVPVRNEAVKPEQRGESLVLWVPLQKRWFTRPPIRWMLPTARQRGVELDGLGQWVWHAINGHRTLEQIIERFADRHQVTFHEARLAVLQFVRMLTAKRLVAVVVRKTDTSPAGEEGVTA